MLHLGPGVTLVHLAVLMGICVRLNLNFELRRHTENAGGTQQLLRKQMIDMMISLESINWKYRHLAREPRVEVAQELKEMLHSGNQRWDILQRRVGSICKRLKYFVSQREEFESQLGHLWQQSMDLDIRLTHLEYFSTEGAAGKIKQLQGLQQKITGITAKTVELLSVVETLLQKSESPDTVTIEAEVWDLLQFQQELFARIAQFHKKLLCSDLGFEYLPNKEGRKAGYPRDMKVEGWQASEYRSTPPHKEDLNDVDSGRSSPSSLDSLPLEWDSFVDIGEDIDSCHGKLPDMLTSLVGKRRRKSQKNWQWAKIDSSTPQRVAVGRQDASEAISVLGEQGPRGVQTQTHGGGHWQDAIDLGRTTETRRMRKVNRHCQEGQSLSCKPSRDQESRDQSDAIQDRGLGLCSRPRVKDGERRLMETKQKQDQRGISLPGGVSRGGSKLHLQSGASKKKHGSRSCFLPLCNLLIILVLFLLLAVMAAFFLLLCIMQEFNWHHKSNFLPFHLTLTYTNGPPSM
ncbi:uncharacterized protein LOC132381480 isoform X2 [Hypanus sabinus]|uniref:uncharacterized protein LOC132381480 isoform X2 n=1 Tax=Hypanus sabinus TaxID=79690 RepID=UPI0028C3E58D|nr:uncharacterized protein LOC132381480 isoform X2 [Hypanus sabinus]